LTLEPQAALDWAVAEEDTFAMDDEAATNPTRAIQLLVSSGLLEHDLRVSESPNMKQEVLAFMNKRTGATGKIMEAIS
jgi:hypothetical protein